MSVGRGRGQRRGADGDRWSGGGGAQPRSALAAFRAKMAAAPPPATSGQCERHAQALPHPLALPSNDRPLATAGRTRAASLLPAEAGALYALREAEGGRESGWLKKTRGPSLLQGTLLKGAAFPVGETPALSGTGPRPPPGAAPRGRARPWQNSVPSRLPVPGRAGLRCSASASARLLPSDRFSGFVRRPTF